MGTGAATALAWATTKLLGAKFMLVSASKDLHNEREKQAGNEWALSIGGPCGCIIWRVK